MGRLKQEENFFSTVKFFSKFETFELPCKPAKPPLKPFKQ